MQIVRGGGLIIKGGIMSGEYEGLSSLETNMLGARHLEEGQ